MGYLPALGAAILGVIAWAGLGLIAGVFYSWERAKPFESADASGIFTGMNIGMLISLVVCLGAIAPRGGNLQSIIGQGDPGLAALWIFAFASGTYNMLVFTCLLLIHVRSKLTKNKSRNASDNSADEHGEAKNLNPGYLSLGREPPEKP